MDLSFLCRQQIWVETEHCSLSEVDNIELIYHQHICHSLLWVCVNRFFFFTEGAILPLYVLKAPLGAVHVLYNTHGVGRGTDFVRFCYIVVFCYIAHY